MWTCQGFSSVFGLLGISDNSDKGEIKLEKYECLDSWSEKSKSEVRPKKGGRWERGTFYQHLKREKPYSLPSINFSRQNSLLCTHTQLNSKFPFSCVCTHTNTHIWETFDPSVDRETLKPVKHAHHQWQSWVNTYFLLCSTTDRINR